VPILPIYVYDQPVLRRRAKPVRGIDGALTKLTEDMFETMHSANGIGLAANQVGSLRGLWSSTFPSPKNGRTRSPWSSSTRRSSGRKAK